MAIRSVFSPPPCLLSDLLFFVITIPLLPPTSLLGGTRTVHGYQVCVLPPTLLTVSGIRSHTWPSKDRRPSPYKRVKLDIQTLPGQVAHTAALTAMLLKVVQVQLPSSSSREDLMCWSEL